MSNRIAVERIDDDNVQIYISVRRTLDGPNNPYGHNSQWLKPVITMTTEQFREAFNLDAPADGKIHTCYIHGRLY